MEVVVLFFIGLAAGAVGGMLGVGGSIVMIPALTEVWGPNQHLYQAAAMIVNFFVVVPAVIRHRQAKAIEPAIVARLIPLAVVAVVIGVVMSELPVFTGANEPFLRGLFGGFLMLVAFLELYRLWRDGRKTRLATSSTASNPQRDDADSPANKPHGWLRIAAVAIPTGLIAGLLGVGGGLVAVPLQRRLLGIDIRHAIANSATLIIATSLIGALVKNYAYLSHSGSAARPLFLAAVLVPGAVLGSLYGSRLTHHLPIRTVKLAFLLLLLVAAWRQGSGALVSLP